MPFHPLRATMFEAIIPFAEISNMMPCRLLLRTRLRTIFTL